MNGSENKEQRNLTFSSENREETAAVILAAGSSSRMRGIKKEFQKLNTDNDDSDDNRNDDNHNDLTVLGSSAGTFAAINSVKIIVIAVQVNEEAAARRALPLELLEKNDPKIIFVNGGSTRRASVYNALCVLETFNPRYVLIHDGARPWVSASLIENIIAAVKKFNAVIPLLPVTETPKEITNSEKGTVFIKRHLKRVNAGVAQTPQAFKFPEILHAHKKAAEVSDEDFTDDAEIWGRFCGDVACIPGERENRKITFREDLF